MDDWRKRMKSGKPDEKNSIIGKTEQISHLLETLRVLNSTLDLKEVLTRICSEAKMLLNSYGSVIYILDDDKTTLKPIVAIDPEFEDEILSTNMDINNSFTGQGVKQKKCLMFNETGPDSNGFQIPGTTQLTDERIITAPFNYDGKILGALTLNKIGKEFTNEDLTLVETFAIFATIAVKNAQNFDNLKHQNKIRKRAEKRLAAHQDHLKLINKILRHDLTNNLTIIKSSVRLFRETEDIEMLDEIEKNVGKSVSLIRRMKELESIISGTDGLKIYELKPFLKKFIEQYNSIDLKIEGNGKVYADETLKSVIDNIINNSVLHGNADKIEIEIDERSNKCEIKIKDNGSGIPDEIQEKIFTEGFKYGPKANTGLGLFIVKKVVEGYGGKVYIQNNKPQGTTVRLVLKTPG